MELKKLVVDSKAKWIDFGGLDGFSVEIANLSRKELNGIRKKCTTTKFNRRSRVAEEVLDEENSQGDRDEEPHTGRPARRGG